ncbi:MAG: RNase adapter RapZ [Methylophilus sp.]|nr:RNase adapter RapZ [Methylophilus sp.]
MQLIIVTGLSGSGKTIALRMLEDSGYYCIDNLPATLLPQIAEHIDTKSLPQTNQKVKVAISIDSRSAGLDALPTTIKHLKQSGIEVNLLYLDSSLESLVKRFSETRRKHPLSNGESTLAESITKEREILTGLASLGHHLDTSSLSANALRNHIRDWIAEPDSALSSGLVMLLISFGFKHGIPLDADFVFDVRSLPNPHYDPELRPLTGKDKPIQLFLEKELAVLEMLGDIQQYLEKWLPSFDQDNRSYLTIGIGCTGGQHRSVYLVEQLSAHFKKTHQVIVRHRELG